ncbi:glycoside hydrolase family 127 protein [Streptomyces sp. DSM 44915]|uniref:Glycoside hydrolase family 127 protein n=1 Tax=Streptomyces chisholmiae TaxID=3075540 RepID=A0ABU2JXW5_9ACTN|nr:beta-L-arabinofuranosidase domain-containing protein [Streptomyces sp. DSM 44915]MDT0269692.1 glycoside hydrolase family 127 protein [Streptomyces sp. DSM 44915]
MRAFPLSAVRLLDSPFRRAQQADLAYLLALDPDRLLAPFRREAGLPARAEPYPNWESAGLDGHTAGHYLSAAALLWAATGDPRTRDRAAYLIAELTACQDRLGSGFVGGIPESAALWRSIADGDAAADSFSLSGRWVPLYNLHKTFAGLLDAHRHLPSPAALAVAVRLADWWLELTAVLPTDRFEALLETEFGGLGESFAELADRTGRADFLAMARRLAHRALLDPLLAREDRLDGQHANTQIAKVVGHLRLAEVAGDPELLRAARFFWDRVAARTVCFGGTSVSEHFHAPDDFGRLLTHREGPETCNTYNLLKLTRSLYLADPAPELIEAYERALHNHVLSSIHPDRPGLVYFTPVRPGHYRVYSAPESGFWCCVGTGLENHARYGELVYGLSDDAAELFVQLFVPSELRWPERDVTVRLESELPAGERVVLTVRTPDPSTFPLRVRRPSWAASCVVRVAGADGQPAEVTPEVLPGGWLRVERTWRDGDRLELTVRSETVAERLPDGSDWVSFRHGPVVLAARADARDLVGLVADDARMGHVAAGPLRPLTDAPLVTADPTALVRDPAPDALRFRLAGHDGESVLLEPFAELHDARYTMYFPTVPADVSGAAAEARRAELAAVEARALAEDARTVDTVAAGRQQPEVEHALAGEGTRAGTTDGRNWREADGWFGYTLHDPTAAGRLLVVTWCDVPEAPETRTALDAEAADVAGRPARSCQLVVDGVPLGRVCRPVGAAGETETHHPLPATPPPRGAGREIRFVAEPGGPTPRVAAVRLLG